MRRIGIASTGNLDSAARSASAADWTRSLARIHNARMRTPLRLALLASFVAVAVMAHAKATVAQTKPELTCVKSSGEARARALGYDHVVTIENGCDKAVACTVSTDVAPEPIQATVDAKKTIELTTFRNSPASVFKPKVGCRAR
ncbi:Hypothetical protein A7982_10929 [Minicystis rosea]|nr:Hypothetical protein A7982_10929 [Minicystis rosea]